MKIKKVIDNWQPVISNWFFCFTPSPTYVIPGVAYVIPGFHYVIPGSTRNLTGLRRKILNQVQNDILKILNPDQGGLAQVQNDRTKKPRIALFN